MTVMPHDFFYEGIETSPLDTAPAHAEDATLENPASQTEQVMAGAAVLLAMAGLFALPFFAAQASLALVYAFDSASLGGPWAFLMALSSLTSAAVVGARVLFAGALALLLCVGAVRLLTRGERDMLRAAAWGSVAHLVAFGMVWPFASTLLSVIHRLAFSQLIGDGSAAVFYMLLNPFSLLLVALPLALSVAFGGVGTLLWGALASGLTWK